MTAPLLRAQEALFADHELVLREQERLLRAQEALSGERERVSGAHGVLLRDQRALSGDQEFLLRDHERLLRGRRLAPGDQTLLFGGKCGIARAFQGRWCSHLSPSVPLAVEGRGKKRWCRAQEGWFTLHRADHFDPGI
jgi:hypothetical protein